MSNSSNKDIEQIISLCNKRKSDKNDFEKLNKLLNIENINAFDAFQNTPLKTALLTGNYPLIEYILRKGADPNLAFKNTVGLIYLHGLIKERFTNGNTYTRYLHYLIQIELDEYVFETQIYSSQYYNVPTTSIELLIKYGADINAFNQIWETPLDIALECYNDSARDLLLSLGAKTSKELIDSGQIYEGWKNNFQWIGDKPPKDFENNG